jgi:toxin ParE1/3/4
VDAFRYYARQAGLRVADRFFVQTQATFARLARRPGIGTPYESDEPLYSDVRYFPVSRFSAYLVFYRPVPGGIDVLRVLHGARDIHGILAEEFGVGQDTDDEETESPGLPEG